MLTLVGIAASALVLLLFDHNVIVCSHIEAIYAISSDVMSAKQLRCTSNVTLPVL